MKFKSIFRRLLVYYITVMLLGFCFLAFALNFTLQELLYHKKEAELYGQANQVINIIQNTNADNMKPTLSIYRSVNHVKMDLMLIKSSDRPEKVNKKKIKLLKKSEINDPNILDQVLNGKRIRQIGKFKHSSNKKLLTIGVPVRKNGKVTGALFLHTPVQEIPTGEVSKLIIFCSVIISIPSIAALYWVSRKISVPLVKMNSAAKGLGKGDFRKRLDINSDDEVGQLADTFNRMTSQLEQLEKMRKELIMNVSHELRTPLSAVRGFIQGIREGVIPASDRDYYIDICYREINRLSSLLNTMLDLSAIESGRIELAPVTIRLDTLIESVVEAIKIRMDDKNISFHSDFPDSAPLKVHADPERLKQILFNLLDNAVRHTPEGGQIIIRSRQADGEVEVAVSDTGSGIHPEQLLHIWERFYTEDHARSSHRERSGLGLTITKQLIDRMNGRISVQSQPGKGTEFTFYLPSVPQSKEAYQW